MQHLSDARRSVSIRPAREADLERLVTIHAAAFPDARGRDARKRNFTENARGALSDLFVAERAGSIVGHAFLFPMGVRVAGAEVAGGGIASVGVAPEVRGTGVATAMMESLHDELRARKAPLALLYPFRHAFYRKLGYGAVSLVHRLRVPTGALPPAPRPLPVRPGRGEDLAAMKALYARVAATSTGFVSRREGVWRALAFAEGRQLAVVPGERGEVSGYVVFTYLWPPEGMPQELDVVELVAESDAARLSLLGLLARQRDQSPWTRMLVSPRDPLTLALDEPRSASFDSIRALVAIAGELGAGAMLKLVDVPAALAARPYAHEGELALRVERGGDGRTPLAIVLRAHGGRAEVVPGGGARTLTLDVSVLAQLYTGALSASDASRVGLCEGGADALQVADALFATPPFFTWDVF